MYRYMYMGVYIVLIHFLNLIITYLGPNTAVYSMKLLPEVSQNYSSSQTFGGEKSGYYCVTFHFFFKHLYWSIIAFQWCVSFCFRTW